MGLIERLWTVGEMPYGDALYRPDDTAVEVLVPGPGAYHPDAGRPIPFRLAGPIDVAEDVKENGTTGVDTYFEPVHGSAVRGGERRVHQRLAKPADPRPVGSRFRVTAT